MSFDGDKWRTFQNEALASLTFESNVNAIFLIKVVNSFAPSISWRIEKDSHRKTGSVYFAELRRWRSDVDQKKFRSPVELLKHLGSLKPTIETERFEIESRFVENTMNRLFSIKIPPTVELKNFGLDGSTTEINFGGGFLNSKFSWWNNPPEEWKELGIIVSDVLNELDSKFSIG